MHSFDLNRIVAALQSVLLELLLNDSGIVDSVSIVKKLNPILDSCALRAVYQFKFEPAIAGGNPLARPLPCLSATTVPRRTFDPLMGGVGST